MFVIIISFFLTFIYHKVVQRHIYGVVGYTIIALLQLSAECESERILKIGQ